MFGSCHITSIPKVTLLHLPCFLLSSYVYTFYRLRVSHQSPLRGSRHSRHTLNHFRNRSRYVHCQILLSYITCQKLSYLANILANTNSLHMSDLYHLVNMLTNTNDILKMFLCYLTNTLANTNSILKVNLYYLVSILWPIPMTRLTTLQEKRSGFV